ncbi:class I SAM-dependent methyltransferase [Methylocystis heyeri]|uniref:Methyltransferase domain-containing protein n=1 Tax=Methylocystis heyeri TaxID=391905 RepID=A0A6B8KHJ8_9HYPH|nr:class I SAM-dependent methyltransferase [Methylocystis heyeri]QGM47137.1 methyltransferase domain-containing protein [Methylocystis heyeri]
MLKEARKPSEVDLRRKRMVVNYHFIDVGGCYSDYDADRGNFQRIYGEFINQEKALSGRVLDIGCGHGLNPSYKYFSNRINWLDGVDPFPVMEPPTHLVNRWVCPLENIPVPSETYDVAYSYNVVEHVEDAKPFLRKATDILKPGGVYWSMSPNYHHPFTFVTRLIQRSGVLALYRRYVNPMANDYPAYYRLSNDKVILRAIADQHLPVSKIDLYYVQNVQWDVYFPRAIRSIAHILDKILILRSPKRSFILMFRLEREAESPT